MEELEFVFLCPPFDFRVSGVVSSLLLALPPKLLPDRLAVPDVLLVGLLVDGEPFQPSSFCLAFSNCSCEKLLLFDGYILTDFFADFLVCSAAAGFSLGVSPGVSDASHDAVGCTDAPPSAEGASAPSADVTAAESHEDHAGALSPSTGDAGGALSFALDGRVHFSLTTSLVAPSSSSPSPGDAALAPRGVAGPAVIEASHTYTEAWLDATMDSMLASSRSPWTPSLGTPPPVSTVDVTSDFDLG